MRVKDDISASDSLKFDVAFNFVLLESCWPLPALEDSFLCFTRKLLSLRVLPLVSIFEIREFVESFLCRHFICELDDLHVLEVRQLLERQEPIALNSDLESVPVDYAVRKLLGQARVKLSLHQLRLVLRFNDSFR